MMGGLRKSWPLILVVILSSCISEVKARHHPHKPSVVVVGVVFCETCFQDDMYKGSHYITGATVAVKCEEGSTRPAFYQEIKTDKQGKFKVQLPFSISKHIKKIQGCTVKLVKSSEPNCAVASTATSSLIHLKGKKGKQHIFSAGFFTFKPLKQPGLCNQQPSVTQSQLNNSLGLVQQPQQLFPPIIPPVLPAPQGPLPIPNPLQPPPLLPNPLQPPAPPLIPNPLQPPATPAPLIPNPFQPPSPPPTLLPPLPPLPNLPPVPVLTPSPPPPPPPRSLIPGIPLPPIIPGVPPLKSEKVDP